MCRKTVHVLSKVTTEMWFQNAVGAGVAGYLNEELSFHDGESPGCHVRSQARRWSQWDTLAREVISEGWHRLWCLLLAVFDPA